jgi:hypothetical protein
MRFYVYQFTGDGGTILYVGKGSGRRLENQERRFGMPGQIVKRFKSEAAAYEFERSLINRLSPKLNKTAGGGGSIARAAARLPAWFKAIEAEIKKIGSRAYVARELLKLDLGDRVSADEIKMLRRVAAGEPGLS